MVRTRSQTKAAKERKGKRRVSTSHPKQNQSLACANERQSDPASNQRREQPNAMSQMNLDVLFLIAASLEPTDLLHLARTCKSLRQLLMDGSSAFVWKNARLQVKGLPDCPTDLNELEYAHLAFYPRCHGCGKPARIVFWKIRRRYCPRCRIERLVSKYSCGKVIRKYDVLPSEDLKIEGEATIWVNKTQMRSFVHEYKHTPHKARFIKDRVEQQAAISTHARECEDWEREIQRSPRGSSIIARIKQRGYKLKFTSGTWTYPQN